MQVIPAINSADYNEVRGQIKKAARFSKWIHLDVADGKFTKAVLWNEPEKFNDLGIMCSTLGLNLEVHLMVENPEDFIEKWFKLGAKRIVVHLEAIKNLDVFLRYFKTDKLALAINPETPVNVLWECREKIKIFSILAVAPGWAGQFFNPNVIDKIKFLRDNVLDAKIEVDGGMNEEKAKLVKEAGADVITSASYIFTNVDGLMAEEAYSKLSKI